MSAIRFGNAVGTFGAGYLMVSTAGFPCVIGIEMVSLLWCLPGRNGCRTTGNVPAQSRKTSSFLGRSRATLLLGNYHRAFCCNYLSIS